MKGEGQPAVSSQQSAVSSQQSGSRQQPGGRYDTHWSLVPASDHLSTESCLPQPGAGWAAWIQLSQEMVIMSWQWLVAGGWWLVA